MPAAIGKSAFASGYQLLATVKIVEIMSFPLLITNSVIIWFVLVFFFFGMFIPITGSNKSIVR